MNIQEKLLYIQARVKAPKNLHNSYGNYNYRNAEGILEAVKPFLDEMKCTMTISDEIVVIGDRIYVKANATLWDTEKIDVIAVSAYAREAEAKKGMDDSQVTGAASSYARKYALNGLFLLDDTKDADTDEYAKQTASEPEKYIKVTSNTPEKAPEMPEKRLSEEKKAVIRALAKQANIDIEATGEDLDTMTDKRGNAMIVALKNKIGEKA